MVHRFADCELDELARELRREGRPVAVEPKVFDLLCLLIHHRGLALSRALLARELWPDTVVSGSSLSRLVKEARRAIGDRGDEQRLIRTVRGLGYRFVATVDADAPDGSPERAERMIAHARDALEAAADLGARDLRSRIDEFVRTCRIAIESAREGSR